MLIEGLVGIVAMIAAAALPTQDYYAMNTQLAKMPEFHDRILQVGGGGGVEHIGQYEDLTKESLRGRAGGAVTLAVGMAHIFDQAVRKVSVAGEEAMRGAWKYWYHFAIMFEALFILTTIDAGTRIGRFLVQEVGGKVWPKFGRTDWLPSALISTLLIVIGWAWFIDSNSFDTIWRMFGIANQMLAVIALAIVSTVIVNEGKGRYVWVTVGPMVVVIITTCSAAMYMLAGLWNTMQTQWAKATPDAALVFNSGMQAVLILGMLACSAIVILGGVFRVTSTPRGEPVAVEAA
jgi:carbon starvation protein